MPSAARASKSASQSSYSAKDIEVLEGLEPVRKRPGMYIGGTDERALHHLFAEVLDNSMDEAVAGHASKIEVHLDAEGNLSVADNGRGIPIDKHPKFKTKSALEVILTTLHSGGKFSNKAYATSGGLHGVGISVVNALTEELTVEVARDRTLYRQTYGKGLPTSKLRKVGDAPNRRGTSVTFRPDPEIFGKKAAFKPARLFRMAKAKAYLFGGVEIRWSCDPEALKGDEKTPQKEVLRFDNGLRDYLGSIVGERPTVTSDAFSGRIQKEGGHGTVEWAIAWGPAGFEAPSGQMADGFTSSYCNTVPTPEGGTHEQGLRQALTRGLRAYAEMTGNKKAAGFTAEDVLGTAAAVLSVFVSNPEFQGQTKDKLATAEATKLTDAAIRPAFDHWLADHPKEAEKLLQHVIDQADARQRRRREKEVQRASAMKKLRLPGKLADCTAKDRTGTEIFLVEGDSAGGSAKQARDRATQAILPLRGKILNVASSTRDKILGNQEVMDIALALGVSIGKSFDLADLRYEKVVIMTDADVDGAHIAALLMTLFFTEMPELVRAGHLYLAQPPLFRLSHGGKTVYALDEDQREELRKSFPANAKVDVGRFKGLGEMNAKDLKETTMDPRTRQLARISLPESEAEAADLFGRLMGKKAEPRFAFIQDNAAFAQDAIDI